MRSKALLLAAAALLFLGDLRMPRHGWGLPLLVFVLAAAVLVVRGVRQHRPASPLPWYCLAGSFVVAAGADALQSVTGRTALDLPGAAHVMIVVSLVTSAFAFGLFVRARTKVLDRYLLLDLSIVVLSASLAFSQLVLDPSMDAHPPVGISRGLSTTYILMLLTTVVLGIRFVTLPGERGRAVWYLVGARAATMVAAVVSNATSSTDGGGLRMAPTVMLLAVATAAAARHPSMVRLTEPATGEPATFGIFRLGGLGLALFLTPLTAVLVHARTGEVSALTILVPGALITMLVMGRLRLLFARERAAHDAVNASRQTFRSLVHGINDVITVVGTDGVVVYATRSAATAFGQSAEHLTGRRLYDVVHPDDAVPLETLLETLAGSGETASRTIRIVVDGADKFFELQASDHVHDENLRGLIAVLHDVTDRHLLETELRHQAFHDVLTGLPNRKLFVERVGAAVSAGSETSVLFVDLDDFKDVNDGFGHHAGDALLQAVGERLQRVCRPGDTVARLGGDEFAILVVDHSDPGAPQMVARRVLEVLERPFQIAGQRISVGASVGVASGADLSHEELLHHADVAMYRAKAAGKGTLALFEPGMHEAATERLSLHVDLAEGLTRGEFHLLYQPVFDLGTGQLRSGEALVRWHHPLLGVLTPDRFITLAEDTSLILPLGRWVLDAACRQATEWPEEVGVAVNLSARQLDDDRLVDDVARTLAETGIRPERLVLEITESTMMRDQHATVERLTALRALGVRIAIDDFGTGYSSLSSLLELPVDILKIDRSFVSTMLERSEATDLVQLVVEMGRTIGMQVVAEGIETPEQAAALRAHRCHQGQGFLYSRPVEAAEFERFIFAPVAAAPLPLFP